jgi:hypothetical protein
LDHPCEFYLFGSGRQVCSASFASLLIALTSSIALLAVSDTLTTIVMRHLHPRKKEFLSHTRTDVKAETLGHSCASGGQAFWRKLRASVKKPVAAPAERKLGPAAAWVDEKDETRQAVGWTGRARQPRGAGCASTARGGRRLV